MSQHATQLRGLKDVDMNEGARRVTINEGNRRRIMKERKKRNDEEMIEKTSVREKWNSRKAWYFCLFIPPGEVPIFAVSRQLLYVYNENKWDAKGMPPFAVRIYVKLSPTPEASGIDVRQ